jgi:hypothetical protein
MEEVEKICSKEEAIQWNRVRLYQQVLFGSDIMNSGGRSLDRKYLQERPREEAWSTIKFPTERPTKKILNYGERSFRSYNILADYS